MAKIKKIVAAALVAAAVGTAGMTAYAAVDELHEFYFEFDQYANEQYSDVEYKTTDYSTPATVTPHTGVSAATPVTFCVTDGCDPDYSNTLTSIVTVTQTHKPTSMKYRKSGTPSPSAEFYLDGFSHYTTTAYGLWEP